LTHAAVAHDESTPHGQTRIGICLILSVFNFALRPYDEKHSKLARGVEMGRKGKSSPAEDFIQLASKLPYWAALILAAFSYFLLHAYATRPTINVVVPGQITNTVIPALLMGLATVGQYVVPILFVAAAILSWFRRSKRPVTQTANTSTAASVKGSSLSLPSCPLCSSKMVMREAKRGTNAGKSFWGCAKYPACKGTRVAE
jgi:hypothetical protein